MSFSSCLLNATSDIYLLNQELIDAANVAIQLNIDINSVDQSTPNMSTINMFKTNSLPLFKKYIDLHGTSQTSYCSRVPGFISSFHLRYILQTYVQPFVIFFTIITNCLTSVVLTHPKMRNSTNIILLGIAICDLLTVLLPLPVYLCFLTSNLFSENLTVFKGYTAFYLTTILPTVCHTSSIWLTVLLALQRFIYVQFPLKANRIYLCQSRPVQWLIILTVVAGLILQLPHMIVTYFVNALEYCISSSTSTPLSLSSQSSSMLLLTPSTSTNFIGSEHISFTLSTDEQRGDMNYISFLKINLMKCTPMSQTAFFSLLLIRVFIVNLIPCIMLTILTGLLIMALRRFIQNRQKLLQIKNENRQVLLNKNGTESQLLGKEEQRGEINVVQKDRRNQREISINEQFKTSANLLTTTTTTVVATKAHQTSCDRFIKQKSSRTNSTDTDSTSKMMLVILGIFLITEVPTTVCLCIYAFITLFNFNPPSVFHQVGHRFVFSQYLLDKKIV
ncbi:unnamed protein product [Heterobilharzia americana]|nr:unnamed protein product [Heterobilharzia americana]